MMESQPWLSRRTSWSGLRLSPYPASSLGSRLSRVFQTAAIVYILFTLSGAVFHLLEPRNPALLASSRFYLADRLGYWFFYLFTVAALVLHPAEILRAARRNPLVPALVLVAWASVAWSTSPSTSVRSASYLSMYSLFGLELAARYTPHELLKKVALTFGIIVVLSVLFALLLPAYGVADGVYRGDWQGVFVHKNTLGQMMAVSAIVLYAAARVDGYWRKAVLLVALLAVAALMLSNSISSVVVLCGVATIMVSEEAVRRGGASTILALWCGTAVCAAVVVAILDPGILLDWLGRSSSLTGRTDLWAYLWSSIKARPLLGYGYGAFWSRGGVGLRALQSAIGWDAPSAHNAFLDTWLELGLAGMALFSAGLAYTLVRTWKSAAKRASWDDRWLLGFVLTVGFASLTESSLYVLPVLWVVYVAVATSEVGPSVSAPADRTVPGDERPVDVRRRRA